jgi:hypothetical protein
MPGKWKHLCGSIRLSVCCCHQQGVGVSGQGLKAIQLAPLLSCPLPACILCKGPSDRISMASVLSTREA